MELNLRKARKLEGKIAKHIEAATLKGEVQVRVKGGLLAAKDQLLEAGSTLLHDLENLRKLNEARFTIRKNIAAANESVGITNLMTQRESLKAKTQLLMKLMSVEVAPPNEVVSDLLESKAKELDSGNGRGYGRTEVTVGVSVVSEPVREAINEEIKSTTKGLEDVEDLLAQKNLGSNVTISEETVALLKANALI